MAAQTGKSILAGKLPQGSLAKASSAVQGHLPEVGGNMGLPAGIENGVAKLVLLQLGTFKADAKKYQGQPYWMAQGVVVSPEQHKGVKIAGERTRIMPQPLCDTPDRTGDKARKTFQQHLAWFYAHLDNLGLKVDQLVGKTDQEVEDKLKAGMAALVQQGVHFKFRTWSGSKSDIFKGDDGKFRLHNLNDKGEKAGQVGSGVWSTEEAARKANPYAGRDPMVNEQWGAATEWQVPDASTNGAVMDETANGQAEASAEESTTTEEGTEPFTGDTDDETYLTQLAEQAANGSDEAGAALKEKGMAAGMTEEEVDGAESWEVVVQRILNPTEPAEEEAAAEEPPAQPSVGEVWLYQPHDPKTGKPKMDLKTKKPVKPFEVVIKATIVAKKIADCLNNSDKKTLYKAVSFDHLAPIL